jgi:hypothetical protein
MSRDSRVRQFLFKGRAQDLWFGMARTACGQFQEFSEKLEAMYLQR